MNTQKSTSLLLLSSLVIGLVMILAHGVQPAYSCRVLLEPLQKNYTARKFRLPPAPLEKPSIHICASISPPGRHG
ncbi:unnamed protein product [Linum trigynum]|uniref:Secreted protein n=1 Tax=Linum trigynum TaxID=586398 RepID=A0AAV2E9W6_9ROSI